MVSNDNHETIESRRRRWLLTTVGAGATAGLAGCASGNKSNQSSKGEQKGAPKDATFVRGHNSPMTHLDPHAINDSTLQELEMMYDQLTDYAVGDPSTIKPMLATDWEAQDQGKTWVFTLRKGVMFPDGTKMDSYAVKRSLERAKKLQASQAKPYGWIKSIEESGKHEVTIHTSGDGFGPAPPALTFLTSSILNPNVIDEHWDEKDLGHEYWKKNTHGTGPWEFKDEWKKGKTNTLVLREENNWRLEQDDLPKNLAIWDEANVTTYERKMVREALTQKQMIGEGDIDFTSELTWTQTQSAASDNDNVHIEKVGTSMMNHYVFLHNQREPTSDVNFRKALTYATDYKAIAEDVVGSGKPWGRPWSDINWPKMDKQYRRDLDKAKKFLDKSIYDGRELEWITSTSPTANKIAEAMTAQFKEIGVNVKHRGNIPWSQVYERLTDIEKHADMLNYFGWPDYIDPNGHAIRYWGDYWPPDGWNSGYYKNERYDELFIKARSTGDKEKRAEYYTEMQKILMEDVPFIWPVMRMWWEPVHNDVKNFHYTPGNLDYVRAHQFKKQS